MGERRIGVDIGGTFTDFVLYDSASNNIQTLKIPSTPDDPSKAVENGLNAAISKDLIATQDVEFFSHASTVTTNTLIEQTGVKTGLLITDGYSAIYETRSQARPPGDEAKDVFYQDPPMLVPQRLTRGVPERMDEKGNVLTELDEEAARESIRDLREEGVEAIAVCFLFSFMNSDHEQRIGELITEEFPECQVALSSSVLPQIREYPRLSTTVVDAYVGPTLSNYVRRLKQRVCDIGIDSGLFMMLSQGGLVPFESAAEHPARSILSGPAAGVRGAQYFGDLTQAENILTMDMGGTSCDTAVIKQGEAPRTREGQIGGQPVAVPMIEINAIGAGGGTIARVDDEGRLRVGPQSAGADPGPICYDQDGTDPTVTDANVVLGRLNPTELLGGDLPVNADLAMEYLEEKVADPLGMSIEEAALGILQVINENMKREMNLTFTRRGYDPGNFALVAFGGAGPTHACSIAERLNIDRVVVPKYPGVNSATGLLSTPVRHETQTTDVDLLGGLDIGSIQLTFGDLEDEIISQFETEGFDAEQVDSVWELDCRYEGQAYELTIEVTDDDTKADLREQFDAQHEQMYGRRSSEPLETVNYRVIGGVEVPTLDLAEIAPHDSAHPSDHRDVTHLNGETLRTPIYDRNELPPGMNLSGPAIVEQMDTTTVIEPGQTAEVDPYGNIVVAIGGRSA